MPDKTFTHGNVEIKIKKKQSTGEWLAIYYENGKRDEAKTYYTDDRQDTEDTAQFMIDRLNQKSLPKCGGEKVLYPQEDYAMPCPGCTDCSGPLSQLETFELIALEHLGIKSLESKGTDEDDFHTLATWSIKAALQAAFVAGRESK